MIPKASQRGGGQQLATHLLNEFDNDRVEVAHVRGAIAQDLHGAFAEWRALSRATKCIKYLYSLSLNPDPRQGKLTREQYLDFIDRTEKRLGLSDQPRAVVFHVKYGREHCHVVWSRVDERTMKAVQLSHDHQSLRTVARDFARVHDLRLPKGMQEDRGGERYKERQKVENLLEQQQEERSGISKEQRVAAITEAWKESKTGAAFVASLRRRGYILARGDKRTYVVVDQAGEIHALARQISGVKTRQVKARLADYPIDKLPDAHKAQAQAQTKAQSGRQRAEQQEAHDKARQDASRQTPQARRQELRERQALRRSALTTQREEIEKRHALETEALRSAQKREDMGVKQAREKAKPGPVMAFIVRITGFGMVIRGRHKRQDAQRATEHARQREALERRHHREIVDWRHREHGLASVDARERRSLETRIRREAFQRATGLDRTPVTEKSSSASETRSAFARNATDITRPASETKPQGALSKVFNDPDKTPERARTDIAPPPEDKSPLSKAFEKAATDTGKSKDDQLAKELLEEFRRRAQQQERQRGTRGRDRGPDRDR